VEICGPAVSRIERFSIEEVAIFSGIYYPFFRGQMCDLFFSALFTVEAKPIEKTQGVLKAGIPRMIKAGGLECRIDVQKKSLWPWTNPSPQWRQFVMLPGSLPSGIGRWSSSTFSRRCLHIFGISQLILVIRNRYRKSGPGNSRIKGRQSSSRARPKAF